MGELRHVGLDEDKAEGSLRGTLSQLLELILKPVCIQVFRLGISQAFLEDSFTEIDFTYHTNCIL